MSRKQLITHKARMNGKTMQIKEIEEAYKRGYEDGYDKGCMDMLDEDYGMDAADEEEETWDS